MTPWAIWIGSLAVGGWYKDAEETLIGADHLAFYTAARLIRDGEAERLYDYRDDDNHKLAEYQRRLIGWEWRGFEAYRNPPFYALLYLPTAGLSFYCSFLVWMALSFALLLLTIRLLRPQRPGRVLLWSLTFYPVFAAISFGQNTFLSMAIAAGVYRLVRSERRFSAGLVAGLLWFKPQLLLGFFVWWAFAPRKYFHCWLGVIVTGAILAGISWGLLFDASYAFTANLRTIVGYHGFGLWNVHTPKAFFQLLAPELAGASGWFALIVAACSVVMAWRIARHCRAGADAMFPAAIFLSLWASPHALIYEWALLVPAAIVLWERYPLQRDAWLCLFALTWIGLTISTPLSYLQTATLHLPRVLQVSVPVLGVAGWLAGKRLLRA